MASAPAAPAARAAGRLLLTQPCSAWMSARLQGVVHCSHWVGANRILSQCCTCEADRKVLSQPTWYSLVRPVSQSEASAPTATSAAPKCSHCSHWALRTPSLACHQLRSKRSAILRRPLPRSAGMALPRKRAIQPGCSSATGAPGAAPPAASCAGSQGATRAGWRRARPSRLRTSSTAYISRFHSTMPIKDSDSRSTRCGSVMRWLTKPKHSASRPMASGIQRARPGACCHSWRTSAGSWLAWMMRLARSCKNWAKAAWPALPPKAGLPKVCSTSCVMVSQRAALGRASWGGEVSMAWARAMSRTASAFMAAIVASGKPARFCPECCGINKALPSQS